MKLFTVGPVEMYPETLKTEGSQLPYFRDESFSKIMKKCERLFLESVNAPDNALFVALTCSGTGGMDAVVQNVLTKNDKALVINAGSFGQRFYEICKNHEIPADTYDISFGESFSPEKLEEFTGKGYTALLVNACETSTGYGFDLKFLGDYCKRNDLLFIIDAVSSYLAAPLDMQKHNADVIITSSHKALALSPGAVLIAMSEKAGRKVFDSKPSYYFDFKDYIENQKRGQPPFTPVIGVFIAMAARLENIIQNGMDHMVKLHEDRAVYFRDTLKKLPLDIPGFTLSNCCTPVIFPENNAEELYYRLKEKYGLVLTPTGGLLKKSLLRVGHLGNLRMEDYDFLIECLEKEL